MSTFSSQLQTTQLFGWKIIASSKSDWWHELQARLNKPAAQPVTIFTPNTEIVIRAQSDPGFAQIISQADYLIPDGVGLIWAARRLGVTPISERIAGVDVVADLIGLAASLDWSVLIIGGRDYQASLGKLPGKLSWVSGFTDVRKPTEIESEQILSELHRVKPTIVFVAFGAPYQETWIAAHQQVLASAGVKLVMSVGGAFDFLLEKVPRAPKWVQTIGLEWLFRLILQPWRLGRQLAIVKLLWLIESLR